MPIAICQGAETGALTDDRHGNTMVVHGTDSEYIQEEVRQLLQAIVRLQAELHDQRGSEVPFETAKEIFFALQFDDFVVNYRDANRIES